MRFSNISAGSLTSWLLIFLLHFFMFLVFLTTQNLPDLISLYSFCFLRSLRIYLIYFLRITFLALNCLTCSLRDFRSSPRFFFSSHVTAGPLLTKFLVGLRLSPTFHVRPLLFLPIVNLGSCDLISSGYGNFQYYINYEILFIKY